ncbi:MAG: hypothetical protein AAF770_02030 [Bacteroidota bacterium]
MHNQANQSKIYPLESIEWDSLMGIYETIRKKNALPTTLPIQ